jgi:hypothetical protein
MHLRLFVILALFAIQITKGSFAYAQTDFRVPYRQDSTISDPLGKPAQSSTLYFPPEKFIDSSYVWVLVPKERVTQSMFTDSNYAVLPDSLVLERQIRTRIDTFKLNWFSYYLNRLQEPVLYNYPLRKEVYRLTWLRSFHPPVVVRLEKEGAKIRIITKVLSRIPELPGYRYSDAQGNVRLSDTSSAVPFKINTAKNVSKQVYQEFIRLLTQERVLSLSPLGFRDRIGTDGSNWILETHRPEGYFFITRWTPEPTEALRVVGDYLLNLSDAKDERRY